MACVDWVPGLGFCFAWGLDQVILDQVCCLPHVQDIVLSYVYTNRRPSMWLRISALASSMVVL